MQMLLDLCAALGCQGLFPAWEALTCAGHITIRLPTAAMLEAVLNGFPMQYVYGISHGFHGARV